MNRPDPNPTAPRILAVDDLPDELQLIAAIIRRHLPEATLETATTGREALERISAHRPDLILLDARLPDIDGFEICRRVKADSETQGIPVLLVSGAMTDAHARVEGLESGADGYLCKPFEPSELLASVRALLRLKQYADRLRTHREELEQELQRRTVTVLESEQRFRTLFENSPDAIFVEDVTGTVLAANPAACLLHGLPMEELVGKNVLDLVPPEDREKVRVTFGQWFSGDLSYYEGQSLVRQGKPVPVEIRGSRVNYNGSIALLLQVRDMSKRKRVDKVIRELAQGVSTATGLPFFYSLVQYLAQSLHTDVAYLGELDPDQPGYLHVVAIHSNLPDTDDRFPLAGSPDEQAMKSETGLYCPRGFSRTFPDHALTQEHRIEGYIGIPLFNSEKQPVGVLAVLHRQPIAEPDFAQSMLQIFAARAAAELERTRAAQELWESEERYRTLTDDVLDTSAIGIFILDADYRIVWMNQAPEHYFGLRRNETIGKDMRDLVRHRLKDAFENPAAFEEQVLDSYRHHRHLDGLVCHVTPGPSHPERWLEHRSQPIKSGLYAGGRIEHYIDVSERRALQDQLLQAQKMESIGRLAGGIAHDFNNLLTSILGFSRILLDEMKEGNPIRNDIQEIIHAGDRAAQLTRQLLAFSRRQVIQVHPLDVNAVVLDMVQLLRRTLGEDIELITLLDEEIGHVQADTSQLEQVILNLAVNARDAMPDGGTLTIQTSAVDPHPPGRKGAGRSGHRAPAEVLLSIRDTGCGMPEEVRAHAFEPFYTTKDVGKGTGLGLSTVYGIIMQFGGRVELHSAAGQGTDVRVYLPMSERASPPVTAPAEKHLPRGVETILLAEDEESVLNLTERILTALGYRVLSARSGQEALELYRRQNQPVHLLLTDVVMPQMGGPRLAAEVQKLNPQVRVLYISGFSQEETPGSDFPTRNAPVLAKPYTREMLARQVRAILDGPAHPRRAAASSKAARASLPSA
jgi:two-component system cell cycle sensor histidine kinase/response regulator CckA